MQNYPGQPPYGAPPGAPPPAGYGPPPGYGPPAPPPPGPPPKKASKWPMFLAIGCVGLLFVFGILGSLAWYGVRRYVETAKAVAAGAGTSGPTTNAPTCLKAVACCRKVMEKTNGPASSCDTLKGSYMTDASCQPPLESYRKTARALGTSCD